MVDPRRTSELVRFLFLFASLYLAFGALSPFFPAFLAYCGLIPEQIGFILFLSTLIRLVSGPIAGVIADRLQALRMVLAACTLVAGIVCLTFLSAHSFILLLFLGLAHAAVLAPTTTLADALALRASRPLRGRQFEYGWVRGAGSTAFILGSLSAGNLADFFGIAALIPLQALFLLASAFAALTVQEPSGDATTSQNAYGQTPQGLGELLKNRVFLGLIFAAAPVLGSHAMHDSFAMIAWYAAGISASSGSVLWSESVAAEVVMFLVLGPWMLRHLRVEMCIVISAIAAALRWIVMAQSTSVSALAMVEPLHGFSFALLHLSCMRLLVSVVPARLAATAQSIYAWGIGATTAVLTLFSGFLYANFGIKGFLVMAFLAFTSLPAVWYLHRMRNADRRT